MKHLRLAALCALVLPAACGGGSSTPSTPAPSPSSSPLTSASENIAPSGASMSASLPNIGGIYGGQIILPPGSGTATLTFSLNQPAGVASLTELTPQPQVAYITITAQSAFTLAASPGLNLSIPAQYTGIDMWLNTYASGAWSPIALGWPSTMSGTATVCFATLSNAVSLQPGQSLYFGINGDNVLPTPMTTSTPPPCPQT